MGGMVCDSQMLFPGLGGSPFSSVLQSSLAAFLRRWDPPKKNLRFGIVYEVVHTDGNQCSRVRIICPRQRSATSSSSPPVDPVRQSLRKELTPASPHRPVLRRYRSWTLSISRLTRRLLQSSVSERHDADDAALTSLKRPMPSKPSSSIFPAMLPVVLVIFLAISIGYLCAAGEKKGPPGRAVARHSPPRFLRFRPTGAGC